MTTGERIKHLRIAKGMSQDEVGKHLGTTKQTIYKYETGEITNIPISKVEQLATLFNVSPSYITGWSNGLQIATRAKAFISNKAAHLEISIDSDLVSDLRFLAQDKNMRFEDYVEELLYWDAESELEQITVDADLERQPVEFGETKKAPGVEGSTPRTLKEAEAIHLIRGLDDYQLELLMLYLATLAGAAPTAGQVAHQEGIE